MNRTLTLLVIATAWGLPAAAVATTRHASHSTAASTTTTAAAAAPQNPSATAGGAIPIPRGVVISVDGTAAAASGAARQAANGKRAVHSTDAPRKAGGSATPRNKAAAAATQGQVYSTDSALRSPGGQITQSNPPH